MADTLKPHVVAFDGLRGVAILLVLWWHAHFSPDFPAHGKWLTPVYGGVAIFLVLSGFLNTRSLLNEEFRRGGIVVPKFYLRQWIRLHPPMLVYLAVLALATPWLTLPPGPADFLRSALFLANTNVESPFVGHLWSMAVQAQFWLIWPWVLIFCSPRWRLPLVGVLVLVTGIWPGIHDWLFPQTGDEDRRFDLNCGPLVAGAALALVEKNPRATRGLEWLTRHASWLAAAAVAAFAMSRAPSFWLALVSHRLGDWAAEARRQPSAIALANGARQFVASLALAGMDFFLAAGKPRILGQMLAFPPLVYLGRWSFSLYLWQDLFTISGVQIWFARFPWNLGTCVLVGFIAYELVEKPVMNWRGRVTGRPTPGNGPAPGSNR